MKQLKVIISLLALLNCAAIWGNDGDTFVAKSSEGVEMTFVIVSEAEKTCKVGTDIDYQEAVDPNQEGVLTIPASVNGYTVVAIGKYAFGYDSKINVYYLPNTIKGIEHDAFYNNITLRSIDIPESVEIIGAAAFSECINLAHVKLHEGLKEIYAFAFEGSGLTSIDLPSSLEYIDYYAFYSLPHLATVTVRSSTPIPHDEWNPLFSKETYIRTILYVPQGKIDNFKADNVWGPFHNIKEGTPLENPTDVAFPEDFGRQYVIYGEPVTININFVNQRTNPINTISYIPFIDGVEGEEQTCEFPQPIAANGEPFTLSVTLPDFDEPKASDVIIYVTKINGEAVDFGADILPNAEGTAAVFNPAPDHRALITDYNSNECLWALRSNIGFEKLKERYGDKVIRASIYITGPMWCEPYAYRPFTPTCVVDGFNYGIGSTGNYIDPYYGEGTVPLGILDYVEGIIARPRLGNLKILSAQWADADQTQITIVTESTIGMSDSGTSRYGMPYWIEYKLLEDGMKGDGAEWEQLNGYSGMSVDDPNLQPLTQLPYNIEGMVYNDVVVGTYEPRSRSVLGTCIYGEPQQTTYTLQLSERTLSIIQDRSKLSVVASLRDDSNRDPFGIGDLIDSYKLPISAYSSGVQSIKQNPMPSDVYDLSGRKVKAAATTLDDLPKGVYIYGGKKIVVK